MNQCDGCKLGLPIEKGIHIHPGETGWNRFHMCCTKEKYRTVKCPRCENGDVILEDRNGMEYATTCPFCKGYGTTFECKNCGGTGECETELYEGLTTCWVCQKID